MLLRYRFIVAKELAIWEMHLPNGSVLDSGSGDPDFCGRYIVLFDKTHFSHSVCQLIARLASHQELDRLDSELSF